jgi:hypothetical protein
MSQGQEKKCCIVCGNQQVLGISIYSSFICHSCEQEMIRTEVGDEKYPFFIQRMKQIWQLEA